METEFEGYIRALNRRRLTTLLRFHIWAISISSVRERVLARLRSISAHDQHYAVAYDNAQAILQWFDVQDK